MSLYPLSALVRSFAKKGVERSQPPGTALWISKPLREQLSDA